MLYKPHTSLADAIDVNFNAGGRVITGLAQISGSNSALDLTNGNIRKTGIINVNLSTRALIGSDGALSLAWGTRILYDSNLNGVLDWERFSFGTGIWLHSGVPSLGAHIANINYVKQSVDTSGFALNSAINTSGFYVLSNPLGFISSGRIDASGLATQTYINTVINASGFMPTSGINASGFAPQSGIDASGFATQTYVKTSVDTSGFATQTYVCTQRPVFSGRELAVKYSDVQGFINSSGSLTGTVAAPIYWAETASTGEVWTAIAISSSVSGTNPLQSRFAFAQFSPPAWATGYDTNALYLHVITSNTNTGYNQITARITNLTGGQYTQTAMVSSGANAVQEYTVLGSALPPFTKGRHYLRLDFQSLSGQKAGFVDLEASWKG